MDISLQWHGPFSVVEGQTDPCLFSADPSVVRQCGVYLWTIPSGNEHLVAYVGMTHGKTVNFCKRLKQELWIDSPEYFHIPDVPKLKQGVKEWIYTPLVCYMTPDADAWEAGEERFRRAWLSYLKLLRIFVAPVDGERRTVKDIETALMWGVWKHEDDTRPDTEDWFLQNRDPAPTPLTYPYRVRSVAPVVLRGITPVVEGPHEVGGVE